MSDSVDESIMLLVATNFADEKTGIEDQAGDDGGGEKEPEHDLYVLLPVEDDPSKTDGHRCHRKQDAKRQEENDFAAPGNAHRGILARDGVARRPPAQNHMLVLLQAMFAVSRRGCLCRTCNYTEASSGGAGVASLSRSCS